MISPRRGNIFYIKRQGLETGSEQRAGRPGLIVSNDVCNTMSTVFEVVYLTTAPKADLPTHVKVKKEEAPGLKEDSILLCEGVTSVDKMRIGPYIGTIPDDIMQEVDKALMISLDLNRTMQEHGDSEKEYVEPYRIAARFYKSQYEKLLDKLFEKI